MTEPKESAAAMQEQVAARLGGRAAVFWAGVTGSTNDEARSAGAGGAPAPAVYGAERQRRGRGRLKRSWTSGGAEAVEMSFLLRPRVDPASLAGVSFAVALGICEGVRASCGVEARIKWPNDVVVGGRKICGILCESSLMGSGVGFVVAGCGINVNQRAFPTLPGAASLRQLTGRPQPRAAVAAACAEGVLSWVARFSAGGLGAIMDAYRSRSAVLGREVEIVEADGTRLTGRCTGFAPDGAIAVELGPDRRLFHASDVSLRGAGLHV